VQHADQGCVTYDGTVKWLPGFLMLACGCGRLGFDGVGGSNPAGDGPLGDGRPSDIGELGSFGPPTQQGVLGSPRADQGPTLTGDLLEIYFSSNRNSQNNYDIFVAKRATATSAWGTPTEVVELASASYDMAPEISTDGLTLWYASERGTPAGGADIWVTTRASRSSGWAAPVRDATLSTTGYDIDPALGDDGLTMTLTSDGNGGALAAIYIATRATPSSAWNAPVLVPELDTSDRESAGSLRSAGRVLYLGHEVATNNFEIYTAVRTSATSAFAAPVLVDTINSAQLDFDAWVSLDERTMFFSSSRSGDLEIYEAQR
jgi:Tol biopolymer transport system component